MNYVFLRRLLCSAILALATTFPILAQNALPGLVVVGDSLSAGFQNNSLLDTQQRNGYAYLIAQQAGTPLWQPEIAYPGIPNVITSVTLGPPPTITYAPGVSPGRTNPFLQATNLAVPGATLQDALYTRPNFPIDSLTDVVLGIPGLFQGVSLSQVEFAERLYPQTLIVWIGNNDALAPALAGNAAVTPPEQFRANYTELMRRLAGTRARLIVANIPDVTSIPYFTSAGELAALVRPYFPGRFHLLGIGQGDFITPSALPLIIPILSGQIRGPLPDYVVLDRSEVARIRTRINEYNSVIAAKARQTGAVLVDINDLMKRIDVNGYRLGHRRVLTTDFQGGVFSLDAVHPTNTGYAIIANEFINEINRRFRSNIPFVNVAAVANSDPLVPRS